MWTGVTRRVPSECVVELWPQDGHTASQLLKQNRSVSDRSSNMKMNIQRLIKAADHPCVLPNPPERVTRTVQDVHTTLYLFKVKVQQEKLSSVWELLYWSLLCGRSGKLVASLDARLGLKLKCWKVSSHLFREPHQAAQDPFPLGHVRLNWGDTCVMTWWSSVWTLQDWPALHG